MDEKDILGQIHALVDEEHKLREGTDHSSDERARIQAIEVHLDQCWDLLRPRRAKRQYGDNPEEAHARPEPQVEGYLQ